MRRTYRILLCGSVLIGTPAIPQSPITPQLSIRDIVNAGDLSSGSVAPGELIFLFPAGAGPEQLTGVAIGADKKVSTEIKGTRVLFDGKPVPLLYAERGQISAVVPYFIDGWETTEIAVEDRGVRSASVRVPVVRSAPALFTRGPSKNGLQASMLNQIGCCNSERNPAARGSVGMLYATGAGQTKPAGIDGYVVPSLPKDSDYPIPNQPVRVSVGGQPAEVLYAGAAPHFVAGTLQVNFRIPRTAPIGDAVPLVLTIGNASSAANVTMAVRSEKQRVLVIDANAQVRTWYGARLTRAGYEVLVAENDEEALVKAAEPVDMVITDVTSSEQIRSNTLRAIQSAGPQLRIAATVAATTAEQLKSADLLGAQTVFKRPLAGASVVARVKALLVPFDRSYVSPEEPPAIPARERIPH